MAVNKPAERGKARDEFYKIGVQEEFGLNKRTRRVKRGEQVTLPNGKAAKQQATD